MLEYLCMRMRKKAYREEILANSHLLVNDPQKQTGRWKELLDCQELHVELGSGKGDYWQKMAQLHPGSGWVAIERDDNIASIALRKVSALELTNARYLIGDAAQLELWFQKGEIDVLHLNFVDPWPKKSHTKRRLTCPAFLSAYKKLLAKNGRIVMKTDSSQLMEYSRETLASAGFSVIQSSDDYRADDSETDAITEYERRFLMAAVPIYRTVWQVESV